MKPTALKISSALILLAGIITLSAHRPGKNSETVIRVTEKWEEYYKVQQYVYDNVCKELSTNLKANRDNPEKYFSRCPSGYNVQFATKRDSVKTNRYVRGHISFYKGCSPNYVCDYLVCVDKGFIVVKSKGSSEYSSLASWIDMKNGRSKALVKG